MDIEVGHQQIGVDDAFLVSNHIGLPNMETALEVAKLVNAVGTVTIAAMVGYIACLQYFLARRQFRLNTYERRFKIFKDLERVLQEVSQTNEPRREWVDDLFDPWVESRFLFPRNVQDYLREVRRNLLKLHRLNGKWHGPNRLLDNAERQAAQAEYEALEAWFFKQLSDSREVFERHLTIS